MSLTVHELMLNFNNYMKSSWPFLQKIDVERDDLDDWDDWTELSYDIFVLSKIAFHFKKEVEYGTYGYLVDVVKNGPPDERFSWVEVVVAPGTKISAVDPETRVIEEVVTEREVLYSYSEFYNPYTNIQNITTLDFVRGEVILDDSFPKGTEIVAPLEACTFKLSFS